MSFAVFLGILSIAFVMSIAPGPVNVVIITSGINHGFKATFAFISGATIGFTLLLVVIAFGLFQLLQGFPDFLWYIKLAGVGFMLYLGYKLITAQGKLHKEKQLNVPKFYEGFLLQWLNPKAWVASVSTVALVSNSNEALLILVTVYFIVCYACLSFWGVLGQGMMQFLNTHIRLRVFNVCMGMVMIVSALSLLGFDG